MTTAIIKRVNPLKKKAGNVFSKRMIKKKPPNNTNETKIRNLFR